MSDSSGTPRPRSRSHSRPRSRSVRRALMAAVATFGLAAAVATAATGPADASAPAPPSGWSQVFLDDFDGAAGSSVNTSNWQFDTGTSYPGGAATGAPARSSR